MKLSQMVVQAVWQDSSPLLQLPYFDAITVKKLTALGVNDIADFQNMEDEDREKILAKFSPEQI